MNGKEPRLKAVNEDDLSDGGDKSGEILRSDNKTNEVGDNNKTAQGSNPGKTKRKKIKKDDERTSYSDGSCYRRTGKSDGNAKESDGSESRIDINEIISEKFSGSKSSKTGNNEVDNNSEQNIEQSVSGGIEAVADELVILSESETDDQSGNVDKRKEVLKNDSSADKPVDNNITVQESDSKGIKQKGTKISDEQKSNSGDSANHKTQKSNSNARKDDDIHKDLKSIKRTIPGGQDEIDKPKPEEQKPGTEKMDADQTQSLQSQNSNIEEGIPGSVSSSQAYNSVDEIQLNNDESNKSSSTEPTAESLSESDSNDENNNDENLPVSDKEEQDGENGGDKNVKILNESKKTGQRIDMIIPGVENEVFFALYDIDKKITEYAELTKELENKVRGSQREKGGDKKDVRSLEQTINKCEEWLNMRCHCINECIVNKMDSNKSLGSSNNEDPELAELIKSINDVDSALEQKNAKYKKKNKALAEIDRILYDAECVECVRGAIRKECECVKKNVDGLSVKRNNSFDESMIKSIIELKEDNGREEEEEEEAIVPEEEEEAMPINPQVKKENKEIVKHEEEEEEAIVPEEEEEKVGNLDLSLEKSSEPGSEKEKPIGADKKSNAQLSELPMSDEEDKVKKPIASVTLKRENIDEDKNELGETGGNKEVSTEQRQNNDSANNNLSIQDNDKSVTSKSESAINEDPVGACESDATPPAAHCSSKPNSKNDKGSDSNASEKIDEKKHEEINNNAANNDKKHDERQLQKSEDSDSDEKSEKQQETVHGPGEQKPGESISFENDKGDNSASDSNDEEETEEFDCEIIAKLLACTTENFNAKWQSETANVGNELFHNGKFCRAWIADVARNEKDAVAVDRKILRKVGYAAMCHIIKKCKAKYTKDVIVDRLFEIAVDVYTILRKNNKEALEVQWETCLHNNIGYDDHQDNKKFKVITMNNEREKACGLTCEVRYKPVCEEVIATMRIKRHNVLNFMRSVVFNSDVKRFIKKKGSDEIGYCEIFCSKRLEKLLKAFEGIEMYISANQSVYSKKIEKIMEQIVAVAG